MAATTAIVGATVAASAYSANKSSKAASKAADVQSESNAAAVEEQRRQFDKLVQIMSPYVERGTQALGQQSALLGLAGDARQQYEINKLQYSPGFQSQVRSGENAILQNASATGGLRGGNVQRALSQYRPEMLNNYIQQRLGNLGGIAQMGQASAAGQASAGLQTGSNISSLLSQSGQAQAGGIIGSANAQNSMISNLIGLGGAAYGAGAF